MEDELLREEFDEGYTAREQQAKRYDTALDRCPQGGAYGLRSPF